MGQRGARPDAISVVEACYDLGASDDAWLQQLTERIHELVASPIATIAYHLDVGPQGVCADLMVYAGDGAEVVAGLRKLHAMSQRGHAEGASLFERLRGRLVDRVALGVLRMSAECVLFSEMDKLAPDWVYTHRTPGLRDYLQLINHHIDGLGATCINSGLDERGRLTPAARQRYQMLGAHIKAGYRLRQRLAARRGSEEPIDPPAEGAVLEPTGKVLHADGDAKAPEAREALRTMGAAIDRVRTRAGRAEEDALEVWQGLVDGRWSLVERYDKDGRRYLLAHRNPEEVRDPRGLSAMELRVLGLCVRGYSNKLIGYHLGVSEGTVSTHLHHGLRKLGLRNRVEAVRLLGRQVTFSAAGPSAVSPSAASPSAADCARAEREGEGSS